MRINDLSSLDNITPKESELRDKLAQRLDLIESHLTLLSTEEYLPNREGSHGFIDILAQDKFGNIVIIELKRSNSASRQAIHELYKYISLIKQNHHIPANKLRCIVVSTTWHELLNPFIEFQESVLFHVEGYQLFLDSFQNPSKAQLIDTSNTTQQEEIVICPLHKILIFAEQTDRDQAIVSLISFLKDANVADYCCILSLDYQGVNPTCIYPYAVYYLPSRIPKVVQKRMLDNNILGVADYGGDDVPEWQVEEALISCLHNAFNLSPLTYDFESGTAEKLLGMINSGWLVTQIVRTGQMFHSKTFYSDLDIIRYATGLEGSNRLKFSVIGTPKQKSRWAEIIENMKSVLAGNPTWFYGILWYCDEIISKGYPNANVSIDIFNPLNGIWYFISYEATGDAAYFPYLEIFIDDSEHSGNLCILVGVLTWDGTPPLYAQALIDVVYGDMTNLLVANHWLENYLYEEATLSKLGLKYSLFETIITKKETTTSCLKVEDEIYLSFSDSPQHTLGEFIASTKHFRSSLLTLIRQNYYGI
jgi:hypothetical protein